MLLRTSTVELEVRPDGQVLMRYKWPDINVPLNIVRIELSNEYPTVQLLIPEISPSRFSDLIPLLLLCERIVNNFTAFLDNPKQMAANFYLDEDTKAQLEDAFDNLCNELSSNV